MYLRMCLYIDVPQTVLALRVFYSRSNSLAQNVGILPRPWSLGPYDPSRATIE